MRADLRPYWVKKAWLNCREAWINYFLKPRCASLGPCPNIMNPWWVDVSGNNIHIGHSFTAVGEASQRIKIGVWGREQGSGCIRIGDAVLLSPGVRIACSDETFFSTRRISGFSNSVFCVLGDVMKYGEM